MPGPEYRSAPKFCLVWIWEANREPRSNADFTLDAELAPHRFAQLSRERKSKARTAVAAAVAGIDLLERLEDALQFLGRDADARVTDDEPRRNACRRICDERHTNGAADG